MCFVSILPILPFTPCSFPYKWFSRWIEHTVGAPVYQDTSKCPTETKSDNVYNKRQQQQRKSFQCFCFWIGTSVYLSALSLGFASGPAVYSNDDAFDVRWHCFEWISCNADANLFELNRQWKIYANKKKIEKNIYGENGHPKTPACSAVLTKYGL